MTLTTPVPRVRFAHLPTPIEALPRLSAALAPQGSPGARFFVKRDDQTGLALGGNKTRKLEFLLAEAQGNGAKTVISVGALQSNHCRQVAAMAARFGLGCILVLSGDPALYPPAASANGNLLLDTFFGAELVFTTRPEREAALKAAFEKAWAEGRRPYVIPLGGSNATGACGYAAAFEEMLGQDIDPDWIVVASSSGGTQAGLVAGACLTGWKTPDRILGISIDESEADLRLVVSELATEVTEKLGRRVVVRPEDVGVNADYLGAGYGVLGELEREAIRLFARTEGLVLDPVYTGRAAAGMIDLARKGFFKPGETVLFWHTGGAPALFAENYARELA